MTRLLFLLKKNNEYGYYIGQRSGLYNSAKMLADRLAEKYDVETKLEVCVDGNSIDKEVYLFKPHICIIEAIWVTPEKFRELTKLHPNVIFVVRIHSEIPFLANEGIALEWINKYERIKGLICAPNAYDTYKEFEGVGYESIYYLPNVYNKVTIKRINHPRLLRESLHYKTVGATTFDHNSEEINIGCFGAIRPMKNQLIQAFAAMQYANMNDLVLNFHINGTRAELGGESVLKNLRNLFNNTRHNLVEHPWLDAEPFKELIKTMDVGMQVSFSESFNIVAADFVAAKVPVIVSDAIKWMPSSLKVSSVSSREMIAKIGQSFRYHYFFEIIQLLALINYNQKSLKAWNFLNDF